MSNEEIDTVGVFETQMNLVDIAFAAAIIGELRVVLDEFVYPEIMEKVEEYGKLAVAFIGHMEDCPPGGAQALADELRKKNELIKLVNLTGEELEAPRKLDLHRNNVDMKTLHEFLVSP